MRRPGAAAEGLGGPVGCGRLERCFRPLRGFGLLLRVRWDVSVSVGLALWLKHLGSGLVAMKTWAGRQRGSMQRWTWPLNLQGSGGGVSSRCSPGSKIGFAMDCVAIWQEMAGIGACRGHHVLGLT